MTRGPFLGLTGLAFMLAGLIGLEVIPDVAENGPVQAAPRRAAVATNGSQNLPPSRTPALVETILGRPLFQKNRRPPPREGLAAGGREVSALPRLTAVVVNGATRSVIFAPGPDGKPLVATEGSRVGAYRVQSISVGEATMVGPEGTRILRPSFGATPPGAQPGTTPPALRQPAASEPSILEKLLQGAPASAGVPGLRVPAPPAAGEKRP